MTPPQEAAAERVADIGRPIRPRQAAAAVRRQRSNDVGDLGLERTPHRRGHPILLRLAPVAQKDEAGDHVAVNAAQPLHGQGVGFALRRVSFDAGMKPTACRLTGHPISSVPRS